jgi:hypothetical protein
VNQLSILKSRESVVFRPKYRKEGPIGLFHARRGTSRVAPQVLTRRMAGTSSSDNIVLVPGDDDVCLGRGNAVNFRRGNANFRQLARDNATSYGEAPTNDKTTKEDIATNIVKEIKRRGGRFLRAISVTGTDGAVLAAWEVVDDETAIGKAKQTLRDCVAAIRKDTAERFTATSIASGGTWPPGEYSQYPLAAGNRGSFYALAEQHQAALSQAHFDDLYRNLLSSGGRRGFNNSNSLFASGGGDSAMSHNLQGDRVAMPHPLRSNLFQQPIDIHQVRPLSVEESKRPDGNALLQQLRTMGSRISDTTFRTEAARGAAAESMTAPLSPLDVTLLECLHRLHQDFILRRHFLLSQLSSFSRPRDCSPYPPRPSRRNCRKKPRRGKRRHTPWNKATNGGCQRRRHRGNGPSQH